MTAIEHSGTSQAPAPGAGSAPAFEPVILGFTCNWCSYRAADLAGTARVKYPPNIRLVRLMCSGRLDPTFVLSALAEGADAVLVSGCHPGDCHYIEQNLKCLRRFQLLQRLLAALGLEPGRVKLFWASAAEGVPLANAIAAMVEEVRALGPLRWPEWASPETVAQIVADAEGADGDGADGAPEAPRTMPEAPAAGEGQVAEEVRA